MPSRSGPVTVLRPRVGCSNGPDCAIREGVRGDSDAVRRWRAPRMTALNDSHSRPDAIARHLWDEAHIAPGLHRATRLALSARSLPRSSRASPNSRAPAQRAPTHRGSCWCRMENHAEHCWAVAVTGALLAPVYDADPTRVFLAGLAHHLANAWLPDAGDAADVALGDALADLVPVLRERALDRALPRTPRRNRGGAGSPARHPLRRRLTRSTRPTRWIACWRWSGSRARRPSHSRPRSAKGAGAFNILHPGPNQAVERRAAPRGRTILSRASHSRASHHWLPRVSAA